VGTVWAQIGARWARGWRSGWGVGIMSGMLLRHHTRAVLLSLLAVGALAAGEATPTPTAKNVREWAANEGAAPSSTRNGTTVTVFTRKGDEANYYILTTQRDGALSVKVEIDGEDYGLAMVGLKKVKAKKLPATNHPDLTLSTP